MDHGLTEQQRKELRPHIASFIQHAVSPAYAEDEHFRRERLTYFQQVLPTRLAGLSEADVVELLSKLWATQLWSNKQYLAQKVIEDNGIENLSAWLADLIDANLPPELRYEAAMKRIRRLGPASITEILCFSDPNHAGIWNDRARAALKVLGFGSIVPVDKYRISADQYCSYNTLLNLISAELRTAGMTDVDLLVVDFFLYRVAQQPQVGAMQAVTPVAPVAQGPAFDHDEVRDLVESIGTMLGFDAQTEVTITHGAKVDAVWRARIGNLGVVTYVFEVHKSGSIDSLLLNFMKAHSNPTVQKVIAIADEAQLAKIEREASGLSEEFRRSLAYWPVTEVVQVGENLRRRMRVWHDWS
ncbi:MAG: hypothetical protein AB7R89_19260 [Dehalococcoidia bacterium]